MASNIIPIALLLASLTCLVYCQSHHWSQGVRPLPGDRLLYREIVRKSSSTLQIVTKDITWPKKGEISNSIINYINATDQYQNGNGGYVSLYNGGVGTRSVTLHFKSQRGHGFNFILDIYGR